MPPTPTFDLTDCVSHSEKFGRYCQNVLYRRFDSRVTPLETDLYPGLRAEGVQIVDVVEKAWDGAPLVLKWSYADFFRDQVAAPDPIQRQTLPKYPPLGQRGEHGQFPLVAEAQIIVDANGHVVVWYLPGIVSRKREEIMLRALKAFSDHKHHCLVKLPEDEGRNRYQERSGSTLVAGVASLSVLKRTPGLNRPGTSREFHGSSGVATMQLLEDAKETFVVLGGILAVTQPWLFEAGLTILKSLHGRRIPVTDSVLLHNILRFWSSPFTTIDFILNRETVPRRNPITHSWCYELLWTLATHNGRVECPDLGYRFLTQGGDVFVGLFGCFRFGIAQSRGEQVAVTCSFEDKILDLSSYSYNPSPPTLSRWQHFFSHGPPVN